jgi:uncharacterized glyoxalase superfamily protein PhnB
MDRMSGSINGSTIIPALRYRDAYAAIEWLCGVLGMTKHAVHPGPDHTVAHAQLTYGGGMLMLGSASNDSGAARHWISVEETGGRETAGLCLVVSEGECRAIYERVKAEGATIVQEMMEPEYGGLSFNCSDPEGHTWWVGSYDPWAEPAQEETKA